jgi:hypothetical protein
MLKKMSGLYYENLVETKDEWKRIKNLKKGDSIYAYNYSTKKKELVRVLCLTCDIRYIECVLMNNFALLMPYHVVYHNGRFCYASDMKGEYYAKGFFAKNFTIGEDESMLGTMLYNIILEKPGYLIPIKGAGMYKEEPILVTSVGHFIDTGLKYHKYFENMDYIKDLSKKDPHGWKTGFIKTYNYEYKTNGTIIGIE